MELSFKNKTVLVTGGTRGIGKKIALDFYNLGAKVFISGTKSVDVPDGMEFLKVDFSDNKSLDNFLSSIYGIEKIDILVNNAGINIIKPLSDISQDDFDKIFSINVKAPLFVSKFSAEKMKQSKYGRIINISSIWSIKSKENRSLYSMTKNAINGLTKTLSIELANYGILVNSISPGFTETELTFSSLSNKEIEKLEARIPLKRFAKTDEISKTVLFLASDLNTYITGQNLIIDGGFTNE